MKLKTITIKGWRSFNTSEGITLDEIKRVNLIIGKNNTGKSNIFKYFYYLKSITESYNGKDYGLYQKIASSLEEQDTWAFKKADIYSKLSFDDFSGQIDWGAQTPQYHQVNDEIILTSEHFFKEKNIRLSLLEKGGKPFLEPISHNTPKIFIPEDNDYVNYIENANQNAFDTKSYWEKFLSSLIFIDPVRHHSRASTNEKGYYFDGHRLIQQLNAVDQDQLLNMREFKRKMNNWLKTILAEDIEFDLNRNLRFILTRGGQEIEENLDSLGTGVSQIFMLLSFLYWNTQKNLNVFLEEPENNIHPDALSSLITILDQEFPDHTYFISTHSACLIDQVNGNWSIHHITRIGDGASKAERSNEIIQHFKLLDDLGYRASQLVQSNIVIWVEGPSDRIYIKKWIDLLSNDNIIENMHYSFIMYGGSNLAGYDLFDNEDNIGILKTSRYAVVVCDSDKKADDAPIKERVNKIYQQLSGNPEASITTSVSINDFVYLWITDGKEIENYIPSGLLVEALNHDDILRKRVNKSSQGSPVQIEFKTTEATVAVFDVFSPFQDHFAGFYSSITPDYTLTDSDKSSIKTHFNQKKVKISRLVADQWNDNHFSTPLKQSLQHVIDLIIKANNLS